MSAVTARNTVGAILMYHRVVPHDRPHELSVAPHIFRRHMQALRDGGFALLRLQDMARALESACLPPNSVAVTIDDGYLDGLIYAADILADTAVPATCFVAAAPLDGAYEFWWDTLDRVFASRALPRHLKIALPFAALDFAIPTADATIDAHRQIRGICYDLSSEARGELVSRLLTWSNVPRSVVGSSLRPMTAAEVRHLAGVPGIDVGAHSVNHLRLPAQPLDVRRAEIEESKSRLEHVLGTGISSFSYPYGSVDPVTQELVRQAGFTEAVTTAERSLTTGDTVFALPRFSVGNWDDRRFTAFLKHIFDSAPDQDAVGPAGPRDHAVDTRSRALR